MRIIYRFFAYLMIPVLLLRLWIKSFRQPAYGQRIKERLGHFSFKEQSHSSRKNSISLWVHAVSLGEVIAAAPLVQELLNTYPKQSILFTTTTPTGSAKVLDVFKHEKRIIHVYAPFDAPLFVNRFFDTFSDLKLVIIMETELWPNWFQCCHQRKIPLVIANARLSEQSQRGYFRIASLVKQTLNCVTKILAQTKEDANRFIALGIAADKVSILGNIKFDLKVPKDIHEKAKVFRSSWLSKISGKTNERPVWIAGSTHQGEEEIILNAFHLIKETHPTALLILVPRHPDRFTKVAELCQKEKFNTVLRTELENTDSSSLKNMDILLGNTIGEMLLFLASAQVAFIGGSLIPQGGHNILEPAALYIPVITGPHMFNFQKIYEEFIHSECIITVEDAASLAQAVTTFFSDPILCEEYASLGFKIIETNQGALEKHLNIFHEYLDLM